MLEALFSSRVRVRLLTIFLLNPEARYHARALAGMVGAQYSAVWKELYNLERIGLLVSEPTTHIKAYRLNSRFPILSELRGIILKTVGAGDTIRQAFTKFGNIETAFIYGSFAAGDADQNSDIDVMIVGEVNLTRLAPVVARLEKDLGRAVNYIAYMPAEWRERQRKRDPFIANVLEGPKIMLLGGEDGLRGTRATRTPQGLQSASRRNQATAASRQARPRHRRA